MARRARGRHWLRRGLLWAAVLAAAALVLLATPATGLAFSDVGSGTTAVDYLVNAGVLSGFPDGTFKPYQSVTRAQAVKIVVKQQGLDTPSTSTRFWDVDSLYAPYVEAAASAGWVSGYTPTAFGPYDSLQRQHLAVWLVRSFGWDAEARALSSSKVQSQLSKFSDTEKVTLESRNYVAYCVKRGFINGDGAGHLTPDAAVTRLQTAAMLYRAEMSTLTVAQKIRFASDHPDKTRVVIDVSAPPGEVSSAVHGNQLFVSVSGGAVNGSAFTATVDSQEVGLVRVSQESYRPQVMSIALDLRVFSGYEVFTLGPSDGLGNRVVIDIFRQSDPSGPPLVAIDPGHGGWDPGAVGPGGVQEKTINLQIAKRLNRALLAAGLRTVMTRTEDVALGPDPGQDLARRAEIANEAGAAIILLIHNNAFDGNAHGTETYYWGTDSTNYSTEGRLLAQSVQRYLVAATGLMDRGIDYWVRGGYSLAVLSAANMPGVLVEVAFIDNPVEAALLVDPAFQEKAAWGIARGALAYLGWDPDLVPEP